MSYVDPDYEPDPDRGYRSSRERQLAAVERCRAELREPAVRAGNDAEVGRRRRPPIVLEMCSKDDHSKCGGP